MMRVYDSVIAGVVNSLAFLQSCLIVMKKRLGLLFSGRVAADRRVAKALCLVLVVLLLGSASLSARHTIAGLARKSQLSVASWRSSESNPTKLLRSLADRYGRYGSWRNAHEASKTGNDVSLSPAGNAGPMPVVPMSPMPPEAPPTFTNNPLEVGVTIVQALHITELREAVNLVRARVGLPAASWEAGAASGQPIKATHILEMRTRLDEARFALGLAAASYSAPAPSVGGPIRAAHVQELRDGVIALFNTTVNASAAVARLDPANQTGGGGENPLSRNYNWSIPLVGLAGRNGLDLGLSLSYNSLVWTKRGTSSISFDDDGGFPSPGFRLGFPVIQPLYFNSEVNKSAFLLITPDGGHVELRQVNSTTLYEAADSSHLSFNSATMLLRTTDGTQLSYALKGSVYQCTEIKDRNGNFITINYTSFNRIDTVVDTLARTIKFNYDGSNYLTSITQAWAGQAEPHVWATFAYNPNHTIQTNFPGLTVLGPANGTTIKALSQVTLHDNSTYTFETTVWGQIWKITNRATDGHVLNYRAYNLPGDTPPHTDCPRFTERHDWAENANRGEPEGASKVPGGPEQEVLTARWIVPESAEWNLPDGTQQTGMRAKVTAVDDSHTIVYYEGAVGQTTGWKRSLPSMVETWGSTTPGGSIIKQKSSVTKWIQDNQNVSYILNPRVEETNVYDFNGNGEVQNRARTRITYQAISIGDGTSCTLPENVFEYQANGSTVLRRTFTEYIPLVSAYSSRRIIGLVSEKKLYEVDPNTGAETLMSKVGFAYDQAGSIQGTDAPVQHDNTSYTASFVIGRGNLSSVTRHNVATAETTGTTIKYNTAGATVASIDPLGKQVSISYADSFSDGNNSRNTLAFPTSITDPDSFSSTAQYNYNFSSVTRTQGPPPAGQTSGAIKTIIYDSLARTQKVAIEFNGNADYSHVRFEYAPSQTRLDTYSTVQEGVAEAHSFAITDGYGRSIASASDHPGSVGGFSGQLMLYDNVGRAIKTSNPTETNAIGAPSQWAAAGDDAVANGGFGWLYTQQTYDWKGRPLVTTNTDLTTREASYSGCGCAGGQVVTLTDEGTIDAGVPKRRQKKIYADILGRTIKTEVLNWEGGSVYAATVNSYNARDQLTLGREYQGPEGSTTFQDTTMTYDGYGRLKTKHVPKQDANKVTTYNYNADNTVASVVDGRGATCAYGYNNRNQVISVAHTLSGFSPINISYAYDGAGNRISMSHTVDNVAQDSATYVYDQLSRLTSETRHLNALEGTSSQGNYTIGYSYALSGELESVTDPFNATINYSYDTAGRTISVGGSSYGGVTSYANNVLYRAWGAVKSASFPGNNTAETIQYDARLNPTQFRLTSSEQWKQMRDNYSHFDDGRLKQFLDLDDNNFVPGSSWHYMSRSYSYDQAARIAGVGPKSPNTNPSTPPPFSASYGYDAFNNMTSRSGQYAILPSASDSATYTNNRRNGWTYDADGRLTGSSDATTSSSRTWIYNAAGQNTSVVETSGSTTKTNNMTYDGNGQLIFESVTSTNTVSNYNIYSTMLGGSVLTRLDASGAKSVTHVPAKGLVAPKQQKDHNGNPTVFWVHRDPLGVQENSQAYDPLGNLISNVNPPMGGPPPGVTGIYGPSYGGSGWGSFSNANNLTTGCNVGGIPSDCDSAMRARGFSDEWINNLPGHYNDMFLGESNYANNVWEATRTPQGHATVTVTEPALSSTGDLAVQQDGDLVDVNDPDAADDVGSGDDAGLAINDHDYTTPYTVTSLPPPPASFLPLPPQRTAQITPPNAPQNPAVDVGQVDTLLQNTTCRNFLNGVLREIDEVAPSLSAMKDDYFSKYFHSFDGAFHNGKLPRKIFGEVRSSNMIIIDVAQSLAGTVDAVEYTAIHESFHEVNPVSGGTTHFTMATAAYNVGISQGLFKRLRRITPVTRGRNADDENSARFDKMLYAACPPGK